MSDAPVGSLEGVEQRLDTVVRLLAGLLTKGMLRKDAILTLSTAGLAPKEVATILGISGNQVSVALYEAKQATAKKAKVTSEKKA
jgi:DNA-directed RNA polymerase specialized sigma24 family protein